MKSYTLAFVMLFGVATAAHARFVTYGIAGTITEVNNPNGLFDIELGNSFFGEFTYDTKMSDFYYADPKKVYYLNDPLIPPASVSVTVEGNTFATGRDSDLEVWVVNEDEYDLFRLYTRNISDMSFNVSEQLILSLMDYSATALSSTNPPESLHLDEFHRDIDDPASFVVNLRRSETTPPFIFEFEMKGVIESLFLIPEPASLTFAGLGLIGMSCVRLRRL